MSRLRGRRNGRRSCHYEIRRWEERVNNGRWLPAGDFAAQVLGSTTLILKGLGVRPDPNGLGRVRDAKQLQRVLRTTGFAPHVSKAERRRLVAARTFAEDFVLSPPADSVTFTTDGWHIEQQGFGQNGALFFDASPATVVYLSATVGFANGTLLWCDGCAGFEAVKRGGVHKFCKNCQGRRAAPTGLSERKQKAWRQFNERMRKAGFAKLGLRTKEQQRQWQRAVKRRLHDAKGDHGLRQWANWVNELYPEENRGRPRKDL